MVLTNDERKFRSPDKEEEGMDKIRVAVVGFGHVSQEVVQAVQASPDMELAGVVLRNPEKARVLKGERPELEVVTDVERLGPVQVAILGIASRAVPEVAPGYLEKGINTVDSFDIHGKPVMELRASLGAAAKAGNSVAVISAGWDPGTDSVVRAVMETIAPRGITYTNFGPGMSMGHTVAIKALEGVEDALSVTIPIGTGLHRRLIYVKTRPGYDFDSVTARIKADPYFSHDECVFYPAEDIPALQDMGHGVHMERKGVSGASHNQRMEFIMSVMNPAATAQVMVSAARASTRQKPGCYTLLEIPPIDCLCGERDALLARLV
jgi:diaminopimelate dehydrogenase